MRYFYLRTAGSGPGLNAGVQSFFFAPVKFDLFLGMAHFPAQWAAIRIIQAAPSPVGDMVLKFFHMVPFKASLGSLPLRSVSGVQRWGMTMACELWCP